MRVLVVASLLALVAVSEGRVFKRSELIRELKRYFNERIPDWVCLVEAESSGNTAAIGKGNSDGSWDHGLFQINDRFWCKNGNFPTANICGVDCAELRTDDISKAVKCAKKVFKEHGFEGWVGWREKCKGRSLPDCSREL